MEMSLAFLTGWPSSLATLCAETRFDLLADDVTDGAETQVPRNSSP